MESIRGLLQRTGPDANARVAAATLSTITGVIRERWPEGAAFLRPISVQHGTVRIRALHSAAAGQLSRQSTAVLEQANATLQRRFPGTSKLTDIQIIRH